jgi:hypothetical protein
MPQLPWESRSSTPGCGFHWRIGDGFIAANACTRTTPKPLWRERRQAGAMADLEPKYAHLGWRDTPKRRANREKLQKLITKIQAEEEQHAEASDAQ